VLRPSYPLLWASLLFFGCAGGQAWSEPLPGDVAYEDFQTSVYPLLLRDCAFAECHGGEHRFFQVFGPGRVRLDPTLKPADPATEAEIRRTYDRALSMIVTDARLDRSLLLTKPLERTAGGQGHKGTDMLGRNVYRSKADPSYAAIAAWADAVVHGAPAAPAAGAAP